MQVRLNVPKDGEKLIESKINENGKSLMIKVNKQI